MDVQLMLAEVALDRLRGDHLPAAALALLDAGYDDPDLAWIAGERPTTATFADLGAPFLAALARLGLELPSPDEALEIVARHHVERIARGEVAAHDGLQMLFTRVIVEEPHRLMLHVWPLYDLYFNVFELGTDTATDDEIVAAAQAALRP